MYACVAWGVACGCCQSEGGIRESATSRGLGEVCKGQLVYGVWCMVYGVWCMVYGVWCLVYGVWCMVYGVWCMVYSVWSIMYRI